MTNRRATGADYETMADSYETEPPHPDEVLSIEINPGYLRKGRPVKGTRRAVGKTPALPVRLPDAIRSELKHRVEIGATTSESELVRTALIEYFENHPIAAHRGFRAPRSPAADPDH